MATIKKRTRRPGEWFADCMTSHANEALAAFLSAQASGYDSDLKSTEVPCSDGKKRPLFRIDGAHVRLILTLQRGSDVLKFHIWKRDHDGALAYRMKFIEGSTGPRSSPAFKSAADRLWAIKSAQTTGSSDPSF